MTGTRTDNPPRRVTDLLEHKRHGATVTCQTAFEILPVDFQHRANPFRAHIFLCLFYGDIDGTAYAFRKCYARGCPNNLCPHVSQAVLIANRYLQRDYRKLKAAGIEPHLDAYLTDVAQLGELKRKVIERLNQADKPVLAKQFSLGKVGGRFDPQWLEARVLRADDSRVAFLYGKVQVERPWAVSYTHLTLPTN